MCIRHLMQELNLDSDVTLVCQDWGGLVGLSLVKDTPDVFSNLVIMNTGLPTGVEHGNYDKILRPPVLFPSTVLLEN